MQYRQNGLAEDLKKKGKELAGNRVGFLAIYVSDMPTRSGGCGRKRYDEEETGLDQE